MWLPWFLVTVTSILFLYLKTRKSGKSSGEKQRPSKLRLGLTALYQFCFVLKSEDRLDAFKLIHKFFPKSVRVKFFKWDYLCIYDPELCKKVFNSQAACQRPYRNCFRLEFGLLASEYHYWKSSRKHLNMAFNLNVLKGFIPIFDRYTSLVVKDMEEHLGGEEFDLLFPLAQLTARTVAGENCLIAMIQQVELEQCQWLVGKDLTSPKICLSSYTQKFVPSLAFMATCLNVQGVETKSYQKLIDSINLSLDIMFKRVITPFYSYDCVFRLTPDYKRECEARKFTMDYGDELIAVARKQREMEAQAVDENGNILTKKDMKVNYIIDQLVNHEEKFTDEEIREHLMVLMITASETSANVVATIIVYLAIFQEIQQKVYDEICEVFTDDNVPIDYDNISSLKFLEMVYKETLRLFSPIPISGRELVDDLDMGFGEPLKKGANIFIFQYVLHRRRDIWGKDADKFNPERFSPENCATRDPYCFLPFGAGPRMCIGNRFANLSTKVEVMKFIRAYKFSTKLTEKDMKMKMALTGKMAAKHLVSIEKRK